MTAIDIGANVGVHTVRMASAVGANGRVYAFEPNPEVFARLQRNIELNGFGNVEIFRQGIAESAGEVTLYVNSSSNWNRNSTMVEDPRGPDNVPVQVRVCPLDNLFPSGPVDFIKIDVEGLDLSVLRSAIGIMSTRRPTVLFEYSPHYLRMRGETWNDYAALLQSVRYGAYRFTGEALTSAPSAQDFLNICARPR